MKVVYSLLLTAAFAVPSLAQPGPGGPGGRGGFGPGGPGGQFGGQGQEIEKLRSQGQEVEKLRDQVRQLEEKLKKAQQPQGPDRKPEPRKEEPRKEEPRKTEVKQPEKKPEIKRDVEVRVFEKKPEGPKGGEQPKGETFQFRVGPGGPGGPGGQPNVMFLQSFGGPGGGMPAGMNKLTPEEQMILKTLLAKAGGMSQGQPGQPQTRQLNPQPIPPKQTESRGPQGFGEGFRRGPDGPGFSRSGDRPQPGARQPEPTRGGEKKPSVEERLERLEKMIQELARSQQRR